MFDMSQYLRPNGQWPMMWYGPAEPSDRSQPSNTCYFTAMPIPSGEVIASVRPTDKAILQTDMRQCDWVTSSDIEEMLEAIDDSKVEPQLRRYCVAYARRVLQFLKEPEFAIALDWSDRFAENRNVQSDLLRSVDAASALVDAHIDIPTVRDFAASAIIDASSVFPCTKAKLRNVLSCAAQAIAQSNAENVSADQYDSVFDQSLRSETDAQCDILRRFVKNPSA